MMLQCQLLPPTGKPFDHLSEIVPLKGDIEPQSQVGSVGKHRSKMGADMMLSKLVGSKFMESASSIFKVYITDSLADDNSSNSNVAIDNKIEQAMDLVKSHLMFAVREEVEILKDQIKDLLAKNHQLEYENSILRADATPETLAKLPTNVAL